MKNRLAESSSPYLLQHKNNPIHWFAWGEEAFSYAKKQDRPVLISIGYSSCHWCHVMAHESFENQEIAAYLNDNFAAIKVDREQHPDVDSVYMTATQLLTGSGGWPMTIFALPNGEAFFCGTYFPPESRFGREGFLDLLKRINTAWKNNKDTVTQTAQQLTEHLNPEPANSLNIEIGPHILNKVFEGLDNDFDEEEGGFGVRPKFPAFQNLILLNKLNTYFTKTGKPEKADRCIEIIDHTLLNMTKGGIFDHIGGGLHRYSTDAYWHLSHFEKMLYDQAMFIISAGQALANPRLEKSRDMINSTLAQTIKYIDRELAVDKHYASAEDADTTAGEGVYYLWTKSEIDSYQEKLTTSNNYTLPFTLSDLFGTTTHGNYHDEATQQATGLNIISLRALAENIHPSQIQGYNSIINGLLELRSKREKPLLDDKILTDWNAMLATGFATLYQLTQEKTYLEKAASIVDSYRNHYKNKNTLYHSTRNGQIDSNQVFLDDYVYLAQASIAIFYSNHRPSYLEFALQITQDVENFFNSGDGSYFLSTENKLLPARPKSEYDSAYPAGVSIHYGNLLVLGHITGQGNYLSLADQLLKSLSSRIAQYPRGFAMLLSSFTDETIGRTVYLFDNIPESTLSQIKNLIAHKQKDQNPILINRNQENANQLSEYIQWLPEFHPNEPPTLYLCENFSCSLPTRGIEEIIKKLTFDPDH